MANKLSAYRLPEELLAEIDRIAQESNQDKTSVVIHLLRIGLESVVSNKAAIQRIQRITPLTHEHMEERLASLQAQFEAKFQRLEVQLGE